MTSEQERVKPGQMVRLSGCADGQQFVVAVSDFGVMSTRTTDGHGIVHSHPWRDVILPEPPKAKPGVRYQWAADHVLVDGYFNGVGLVDGRIFSVRSQGIHTFKPELWREVDS